MASASLPLTVQELIEDAIGRLETLAEPQIPLEDSCPICLNSFMSIVKDTTAGDSKADSIDLAETSGPSLGVTRLQPCGHVFCKLDMVEWIRGGHGTCPACRYILFDVGQVAESDGESSDGDYIPGEDDNEEDDEDDDFLDTDGFEDTEMAFGDLMDVEVPDEIQRSMHAEFAEWYDGDDEDAEMFEESMDVGSGEMVDSEAAYWELSDGGSEMLSEEDVAINGNNSTFGDDVPDVPGELSLDFVRPSGAQAPK